MIKTWAADISPLYEEACYREYYYRAPVFRREKADRMKVLRTRVQSIGAWTLYEQMKKEYGVKEDTAFNLSHSGRYVLCSVVLDPRGEPVRVGCDIEQVKECDLRIARRFFCPSEYEQIIRESDQNRQRELFYRFWVLKESFVKATRKGMALGLDTFEIRLGDPPVLVRQPAEFPESYTYKEFETEDKEYKIAVCSTDGEIDSVVQMGFGV